MEQEATPAGMVGPRLRFARVVAGMTQQSALRAHVSLSLVKKVEQGTTPASPAFISACARALRIEPADLTGQPYAATDRVGHEVLGVIPALRRELGDRAAPARRAGRRGEGGEHAAAVGQAR